MLFSYDDSINFFMNKFMCLSNMQILYNNLLISILNFIYIYIYILFFLFLYDYLKFIEFKFLNIGVSN